MEALLNVLRSTESQTIFLSVAAYGALLLTQTVTTVVLLAGLLGSR